MREKNSVRQGRVSVQEQMDTIWARVCLRGKLEKSAQSSFPTGLVSFKDIDPFIRSLSHCSSKELALVKSQENDA